MKFSFTDRVVVNPAGQFFDRPTLVSNDLEYADASPTMPDNKKTTLGHILQQAQRGNRDLSQALAYHQIGYVLVAKENDYKSFDFIMDDPDLKLVKETPSLKLYRNYDYGRQP